MENNQTGAALKATEEGIRLFSERSVKLNTWRNWGPYLSERQWGTVREDYSKDGSAWEDFPHDQARSRAYRWGEDGIAGISDKNQLLCFALAFWNGNDPIIKERLFGLTGNEGNHGEDVKEVYYYLDNTPSHSYMKYLYRYTQQAYPYYPLTHNERNDNKDRNQPEYELVDTGAFNNGGYFDIQVEYAKQGSDDIFIKISATNRAKTTAPLDILPTVWFRNTWSWDSQHTQKPLLTKIDGNGIHAQSSERNFGDMYLYAEGAQDLLFCENETNLERFAWGHNNGIAKKDAINNYIVSQGRDTAIGRDTGTKAAFCYHLEIGAGETKTIMLRLCKTAQENPLAGAQPCIDQKLSEADAFYAEIFKGKNLDSDQQRIARQAYAGMLWGKQFYYYVVGDWLKGDNLQPAPPVERNNGRNSNWTALYNEDIITMPDTWEYPWYATWDLAFHTVTLANIDPDFAQHQLRLFTCEWYMHPNGQLPAYEWNFNDVNPPVHAWAAWRVYSTAKESFGFDDQNFLTRVYTKLLMYFTWWTNRKDAEGNNIFEGGFLGLDNISALDRSNLNLRGDAILEQADGTAWMGFFSLSMLKISVALAKSTTTGPQNTIYGDLAYKFFQHFLLIADSFNKIGGGLWDNTDQFYYDMLKVPNSTLAGHSPDEKGTYCQQMKLRSLAGLMPIIATEQISLEDLNWGDGDFMDRVQWFIANRKNLTGHDNIVLDQSKTHLFLSLVSQDHLTAILNKMLDPNEFLSDYGIRSLSKYHERGRSPYTLEVALIDKDGNTVRPYVEYCPAESNTGMFGGNSNWRGPVWMPVNYLIIEALKKYNAHYPNLSVEFPVGSGQSANLLSVANQLSIRLASIFKDRGASGRPVFGGSQLYQSDWKGEILFYEYFHGDNGAGIGASHQTGWTGLIANILLGI